jgi:xanthine dehydrogenase YagR molybdenum-binding subunit
MSLTTDASWVPRSRVDGRAKVTGQAKFVAEHSSDDLAHAAVVASAVARGRIVAIDSSAATAVEGVIAIFTHENAPSTARQDRKYSDDDAPPGSPFRPLRDAKILFSGQPLALVVAETIEQARYAASLVAIEYEIETPETSLEALESLASAPRRNKAGTETPKSRGDAREALERADARILATYVTPHEYHNPMEMHASTVLFDAGGSLTIYDKTQGVINSQTYVCNVFDLPPERVRVKAPFIGGAFGSGLRPNYQLYLAAMAALELRRSVRLVLTRQQMFTFGHRPHTIQTVELGARGDGTLVGVRHEAIQNTSRFEGYTENVVNWSGRLYRCADVELSYKTCALDFPTPTDMRAPGAALGLFALECGMDELAVSLGMDPVALRLANYAEREPTTGLPFSSKALRECYAEGAERFGWRLRDPRPRGMRRGNDLLGWGMATGIWEALLASAQARVSLHADGRVTVASAATDIGTGTYNVMAIVAAEALGIDVGAVSVELGDSSLPQAPLQGGSWTAASVGSAVQAACAKLLCELDALARAAKANLGTWPSRLELMRRAGRGLITADGAIGPSAAEAKTFAHYTHSAVFVEVAVDEDVGMVRVPRVVSAVAGGRILSPPTARSQILGGVVWGIGMALHEEASVDHGLGRIMNHDLAGYHVPVQADVEAIEVLFVDERDEHVNPLGAKGLGEIGIVGVAAAVANAVYHATGRRVRELPITPDKVLGLAPTRQDGPLPS